MITTKAFITEVPEKGSNKFKVNVPLMTDNTGGDAIYDAIVCTSPESYNGYSVGDCVFVTWEDDQYNKCVIMGKLYIDVPEKSTSYNLLSELKVIDAATLPPQTNFGDYTAQDLIDLYNRLASADFGAGNGNLVKYKVTEYYNSEGDSEYPDGYYYDYYVDTIQVMSGEAYDELWEAPHPANELEEMNNTMYFLTSPPPSEAEKEEEYAPRDDWS